MIFFRIGLKCQHGVMTVKYLSVVLSTVVIFVPVVPEKHVLIVSKKNTFKKKSNQFKFRKLGARGKGGLDFRNRMEKIKRKNWTK